jgi:hypothetical protein
MKLVDVDSLSLVLLFPLLASAVVAATPVRVARVLAGVAGVVGGALAVGHAVACATIGGFGDQAGGGYVAMQASRHYNEIVGGTAVRQLSKQIQLVRIFVVEGLQRPVTKQLV